MDSIKDRGSTKNSLMNYVVITERGACLRKERVGDSLMLKDFAV